MAAPLFVAHRSPVLCKSDRRAQVEHERWVLGTYYLFSAHTTHSHEHARAGVQRHTTTALSLINFSKTYLTRAKEDGYGGGGGGGCHHTPAVIVLCSFFILGGRRPLTNAATAAVRARVWFGALVVVVVVCYTVAFDIPTSRTRESVCV